MTAADYVGIAGLITSSGAVAVSIIVALRQSSTHAKLDEVRADLATPNGGSVGSIVAANDLTGVAHDTPPVAP